jgi:hypothetical protein
MLKGMPSEALTPLTPLSRTGERGIRKTRFLSSSLLSLWERRVGVVRASEGRERGREDPTPRAC